MASDEDKALFKAKNKKVKDKVKDYAPNGGPFVVPLRAGGQVQIQSLNTRNNVEGVEVLEVYVGDPSGGDPHFVIMNPPTYVRERNGSLTEDPVAAVAEVIASAGGRRQKGRKGL